MLNTCAVTSYGPVHLPKASVEQLFSCYCPFKEGLHNFTPHTALLSFNTVALTPGVNCNANLIVGAAIENMLENFKLQYR